MSISAVKCEFEVETKNLLEMHDKEKHNPEDETISMKNTLRKLTEELQQLNSQFRNVKEERDALKSELLENIEASKQEKFRMKTDKETIATLHSQLKDCREEIVKYVETNEIILEENKVIKEIKKTKEDLAKKRKEQEEIVEIEECDDVEEQENNSDIDDMEAAACFLRNKNAKENVQKPTGTKPKIFRCNKCLFEVKTETKLEGHNTVHEKGNVNYVPMVNCEKCALLFKTAGLLRRHLKAEHGILKNSLPPNQDNAKNFEQRIKCDQCEHRAANRNELIEHLDEKHTERKFRCVKCGMRADDQSQLKTHNQICHENKKTLTTVCKFWTQGLCYFDKNDCRFDHPEAPKCRYKSKCTFWPNCKFFHDEKECRFQENCLNANCVFMHHTNSFLAKGHKTHTPNIQSYQEFPPFPQQMWRPW